VFKAGSDLGMAHIYLAVLNILFSMRMATLRLDDPICKLSAILEVRNRYSKSTYAMKVTVNKDQKGWAARRLPEYVLMILPCSCRSLRSLPISPFAQLSSCAL
jgi:hypothetical protein